MIKCRMYIFCSNLSPALYRHTDTHQTALLPTNAKIFLNAKILINAVVHSKFITIPRVYEQWIIPDIVKVLDTKFSSRVIEFSCWTSWFLSGHVYSWWLMDCRGKRKGRILVAKSEVCHIKCRDGEQSPCCEPRRGQRIVVNTRPQPHCINISPLYCRCVSTAFYCDTFSSKNKWYDK